MNKTIKGINKYSTRRLYFSSLVVEKLYFLLKFCSMKLEKF